MTAQWALLAERATLLSDDIRETLGTSEARELSPDAQLNASAVATLLNTFSRMLQHDSKLGGK